MERVERHLNYIQDNSVYFMLGLLFISFLTANVLFITGKRSKNDLEDTPPPPCRSMRCTPYLEKYDKSGLNFMEMTMTVSTAESEIEKTVKETKEAKKSKPFILPTVNGEGVGMSIGIYDENDPPEMNDKTILLKDYDIVPVDGEQKVVFTFALPDNFVPVNIGAKSEKNVVDDQMSSVANLNSHEKKEEQNSDSFPIESKAVEINAPNI